MEGGSEQVWLCAGKPEVAPATRLKCNVHEMQEIAKVRGGGGEVGEEGAISSVRLCSRKSKGDLATQLER